MFALATIAPKLLLEMKTHNAVQKRKIHHRPRSVEIERALKPAAGILNDLHLFDRGEEAALLAGKPPGHEQPALKNCNPKVPGQGQGKHK